MKSKCLFLPLVSTVDCKLWLFGGWNLVKRSWETIPMVVSLKSKYVITIMSRCARHIFTYLWYTHSWVICHRKNPKLVQGYKHVCNKALVIIPHCLGYHLSLYCVLSGLAKRCRARLLLASTSEVYGGRSILYTWSRGMFFYNVILRINWRKGNVVINGWLLQTVVAMCLCPFSFNNQRTIR